MKTMLARLLSTVLLCGWAGATLAVEIELGPVGNDDPDYLWCIKAQHKVRPGKLLDVTFRGRGVGEARIHLVDDTSAAHFMWQEILEPDSDHSPRFYFGPTMAVLTMPSPRKLQVRLTAPARLHYVRFIGVQNTEETPSQGCLIEVVNQLPDVEVTGLRYDPPETGVVGRTVRMTVRNNMTPPAPPLVAVPWSISLSTRASSLAPRQERVLSSGVQNNVQSGSTFEVTAHYTINWRNSNPISDQVIGHINLGNFIGENDAELANNQKSIGDYPPTPPPVLVTQELDFAKAQANGARFKDNVESNTGCFRLGVDDWSTAAFVERKSGVIFISNCVGGGKASPEAYLDFRLKNGWRIKSVDEDPQPQRGNNGFTLTWKPQVGSDNPYMHAHIWSGFLSNINVGVRITIEGPAGTDPYVEGSTCPSGCALSNSVCVTPSTGSGTGFSCAIHQDCDSRFGCDSSSGTCVPRCPQ